MTYYKLEGKKVVTTTDITAAFKGNRTVAKDTIGDVDISTVFLGIDHGFNGRILLFETMVFGGEFDQDQDRYETWDEAEKGHKFMVDKVKKALKQI